LDPSELQRATTSSDGGSGLRHARCRDSIDLTSAPEPGSHSHHQNHHNRRGAFGSLAGSVAGMASNVAAAIGNRLRSSQAGAAYKVPGLEPAGRSPNRGSLDLQVPAGERGPTLPGARGASVLLPAAEAAQLAAAVGQQVNNSSSKQQPKMAAGTSTSSGQPAAVPAMWLLPTAPTSGQAAAAAASTAAAGWGASGGLHPNTSRGTYGRPAAGGHDSYYASGLQAGVGADEVVGGSTFLLPSRSRVNLRSPNAGQQPGSPRSPPAWG
jgi:hypothetical protein